MTVSYEINPLNLISPWLDINYQITTKCATVTKPKFFRELNTALVDQDGYHYLRPSLSETLYACLAKD